MNKNEKKTIKTQIVNYLLQNQKKSFNYKQIAKAIQLEKSKRNSLAEILNELLGKNILSEVSRGKYIINPSHQKKGAKQKYVTGVIDMKQTGKAYLITEEFEEDVKIAANNTSNALPNDHVKVMLFPLRKGRKLEGKVVEIIKRAKTVFVGTIQLHKNFGFLVPDNVSMPVDIFIPKESLNNAKEGQKAMAEITEWPERAKNPFGKIISILGNPGDNEVEMNAILAEFEFPLRFPEAVEAEAKKIPTGITASEIKKRKDFRSVPTLTIDPEDAKDFDDALSVRAIEKELWEIGVHIADVSHYVKPSGKLDEEAYRRGTSVYLVDRVIPMLPEVLSNNVCSLNPNEDKLCFSAVFHMNSKAEIIDQWFGKTIINSDRRFDYNEVQQILENEEGDLYQALKILNHCAKILRKERFRKGAFAFDRPEIKFRLNDDGKPVGVYVKEYNDAHKLIEEFMLLANKKVAEIIGKTKNQTTSKTFVYRVHDHPNPEKLEELSDLVRKFGYRLQTNSRKAISNSMNSLLANITGKGEENMIETLALRTMAKAKYTTENIGHYGLAFDYYTHFTSPIRRYPDLMVHRLLEKYMNHEPSVEKEPVEKKCEHASEMERRALESERASIKYKQVEFLSDKIGNIYKGVISGVSKWGIFVEIKENKCEGMVRLKDMIDDFYFLDEDSFTVVGQRYGIEYRLGDEVVIKVKKADLSKKQLDFVLIEEVHEQ